MPPWGGRDLFRVHHTGHVALTAAGRGGGLGQVGYSILTQGGGLLVGKHQCTARRSAG